MTGRAAHGEVDGRAERSRRTKESIVAANMSLLREGDLKPTAERIADRAGVSVRALWTHFAELESLSEATAAAVFHQMGQLQRPIDPCLGLPDRIGVFIDQRMAYLEALEPFALASEISEARSPTLRRHHAQHLQRSASEIESVFAAELALMDDEARSEAVAALVAATSWRTLSTVRDYLGLGRTAAMAVMARTVAALLRDGGRGPAGAQTQRRTQPAASPASNDPPSRGPITSGGPPGMTPPGMTE